MSDILNENLFSNSVKMADIGEKLITHRIAVACGKIFLTEKAYTMVKNKTLPKGDPLLIAEIAGINAAKHTSELIPLCHQINLDKVLLKFFMDSSNNSIHAFCAVYAHAKTGVEMEAISGVNAALITMYDLIKNVEKNLSIGDIKLIFKIGGKSGRIIDNSMREILEKEFEIKEDADKLLHHDSNDQFNNIFSDVDLTIITMSDRAYSGRYDDTSGQMLYETLLTLSPKTIDKIILPDDSETLENTITEMNCQNELNLVLIIGGTGLNKRDITYKTIKKLCKNDMIPGIGEYIRKISSEHTQHAWISRSCAGFYTSSFKKKERHILIVALPGNPKAINQIILKILPIIKHALHQRCA